MSLLGIDMGTSGCKAVVFDHTGGILAESSRSYATYSPAPGFVEMDPELFWEAFVEVTRAAAGKAAAGKAGEDPDAVEALAISSHGETFIPVDESGQPVGPAIMNSDSRATAQSERWERDFGKERVYRITGMPLHPMYTLNKILWLKDNAPEVFRKAERFLKVQDFLLARLGLPPYIDHSLASRTMAFDIMKKRWDEEILAFAGLSPDRLGIPMPSAARAGEIDAERAEILGLEPGVAVAVGGHDQPCGALGTGVLDEGDVADSAGTYECLSVASREPRNTPEALSFSLNTYCHVVPDRYITLAFCPAGFVTNWYVEQFCAEDRKEAEREGKGLLRYLDERIAEECGEPTGICITPHFIGSFNPHWDVRATGTVVGLTPGATRHRIYKAIYEGIACEVAINIEVLEKITGGFAEIGIYGGNASSAFSVQLRADIGGKRMKRLRTSQAVCKGAAMLAGIAIGVYRDVEDAVSKVVRFEKVYSPNPEDPYETQLARYRLIHPALEPIRALRRV